MIMRVAASACLAALAFVALPAAACVPVPPIPPLPGESQEAYRARSDAEQKAQAARWFKERQTNALQNADVIFIARDTDWWPTPKLRYRNGRPLPPVLPLIPYPAPSYYKPIAWFRGARTTGLFKVERDNTSCGPMSLGDTTFSRTGQLFVFFAKKGPLNKRGTLMDAIAVDRIDDPALMEFVARYRGKSPPAR